MGIDNILYDIMIESIEVDHAKKCQVNCSQADQVFEALDDQKRFLGVAPAIRSVAGEFTLHKAVPLEAGLPQKLTLYCREFGKNICGKIGHPNHIAIFAGPASDLADNPAQVLKNCIQHWRQVHHHYQQGKNTQKVLIVFQDQTLAKADSVIEMAASLLTI